MNNESLSNSTIKNSNTNENSSSQQKPHVGQKEILNQLNHIYIETDKDDKIIWANKTALKLLKFKLGQPIATLFHEKKELYKNKTIITTKSNQVMYMHERSVLNLNKDKYFIHSLIPIQKELSPILVRQQSPKAIQTIIEQQLGKNAHLFALIGMTVSLDIKSKEEVSFFDEFIAQSIENILFSIYLVYKDRPIQHRHLTVAFQQKLNRNHLYFQIPDDHFQETGLGKHYQYRNKIEGTIAEVIKQKELLLASLNGRTIIYTSVNENKKNFVSFYLSFDKEKKETNYRENN